MLKFTLKLIALLIAKGYGEQLKGHEIDADTKQGDLAEFSDEVKSSVLSMAGLAIAHGEITADELKACQADKKTENGGLLKDFIEAQNDRMSGIEKHLGISTGSEETPSEKCVTGCKCDDCLNGAKTPGGEAGRAKSKGKDGKKGVPAISKELSSMFSNINANAADGADGKNAWAEGDVKCITALYDGETKSLVYPTMKAGDGGSVRHPFAGQTVKEGNRLLNEASELQRAKNGAWFKLLANSQTRGKNLPYGLKMTDEDHQLVNHMLHNDRFGGCLRGYDGEEKHVIEVDNQKLSAHQIKNVIDDTLTGGLEIAPIAIDDAVITIPFLYGELFPYVNVIPVTRGRRIESATLGNVTVNSVGSVRDDQTIALFATNGFISAFDTTIHVCDGAIELGLDHMSDSLVDLGSHVTQKYGESLLNWLDEQVAIGDGVIEPEGIMNAAGTTAVAFNGVAPTIGGYEALLFGVPKRYKKGTQASRIMYCSNELTYSRARGIPVGAADARRVYGMDQENYRLFTHNYAIVDAMQNSEGFFANMSRYRMYRRLGLTMRITAEGRQLVRENKMLISSRARFGGQLEDGLAAATANDLLA